MSLSGSSLLLFKYWHLYILSTWAWSKLILLLHIFLGFFTLSMDFMWIFYRYSLKQPLTARNHLPKIDLNFCDNELKECIGPRCLGGHCFMYFIQKTKLLFFMLQLAILYSYLYKFLKIKGLLMLYPSISGISRWKKNSGIS